MKFLKALGIAILLSAPAVVHGQDVDARSPKPQVSSGKQAEAEKKKAKKAKQIEKSVEKAKKQHMKLQTKNTRKMMRKSRRSSGRWDQGKREFFLKRWFKKKHR
ncbi:MAG: hypothetical protein IPP51_01200 [Bacteroidetes bacterium]|nr:hypothetical protein [Bacteroidota bacterium]